MPYRDAWATCEECGKQFIFTVEEQRRLAKLEREVEPSLCPDCQKKAGLGREAAPSQGPDYQKEVDLEPGYRQGTVKWYDSDKRYGFITQRGGEDIFFHRNSIAPGEKPRFPDGTPVTYRVEQGKKGPEAVDVARI